MVTTLKILFTVLIVSLAIQVDAQQWFYSKEDKRNAGEHITALKEGILLVRLTSDRKKIETLQSSLARAESEKDKAHFEKQLGKAIEERDEFISSVVSGVEEKYSFSDYAFFYDYDTQVALQKGENIWQSDLKTRFDKPEGRQAYVLTTGKTPNQNVEGFIILTDGLNEIPMPFPNKVIRSIFISKTWKYISKLDSRLWAFHTLVQAE